MSDVGTINEPWQRIAEHAWRLGLVSALISAADDGDVISVPGILLDQLKNEQHFRREALVELGIDVNKMVLGRELS